MTRTIDVEGMACGGCETTVAEALSELPGVESAHADHASGTATVEGDADTTSLIAAVEDAGYEAAAR